MKNSKSTASGVIGGMAVSKSQPGNAGFQTSGYLVKKGTPQGDGAKFNHMPPGMDISDQDISDIREMPYKEVTGTGYPGDGWQD